jgi:hypothetical protein
MKVVENDIDRVEDVSFVTTLAQRGSQIGSGEGLVSELKEVPKSRT